MQVLQFLYIYMYFIVALNILYSVTTLGHFSSFTSFGFLQFDSPFLIDNNLNSPEIFILQLISPMF